MSRAKIVDGEIVVSEPRQILLPVVFLPPVCPACLELDCDGWDGESPCKQTQTRRGR